MYRDKRKQFYSKFYHLMCQAPYLRSETNVEQTNKCIYVHVHKMWFENTFVLLCVK